MGYKYNAELEVQHVGLGSRLATCLNKDATGVMLVKDDWTTLVVVSFKDGYCNNAQSYELADTHEAWNFFDQLRREETDPKI
jgi:hypothetical protein